MGLSHFFVIWITEIKVMASIEEELELLIAPVIELLGCNLVRIRMMQAKSKILEVMIEKQDAGAISIEQCKEVSNNISAALDAEDLITTRYNLEVCSAGIERPLVKLEDYDRFKGRVVSLKLLKCYNDTKKIRGTLKGLNEDNGIVVELEGQKATDVAPELIIDFNDIRDANLVLTDELYREIVSKK